MFSYRHAFHAGNHADVLKHSVLLAILRHLLLKDSALMVIDTHAGAGLYRLDDTFAQTSGEAAQGFLKIQAHATPTSNATDTSEQLSPLLSDYLTLIAGFESAPSQSVYPGSPLLMQRLLRAQDKLKAFELHPTDSKLLAANFEELDAGRQIAMFAEDGFEGVRKFLPPPSRRALVLTDPSYEIKSDYAKVVIMLADSLKRFATGTYAVWYPIIARAEALDLPRKLNVLAGKAGKSWLNATLTVKSAAPSRALGYDEIQGDQITRTGLPASGMFILNPPYTLSAALRDALPQMVRILGQDRSAAFTLTSSEG
jgi:23S rRNA (adenine2030-N6)-methyltransferase